MGASIWETYCLECHSPGGIGPRIRASALTAYQTPAGLVSYTRLTMPYGMGGVLSDEEYFAVVAYLLHEFELLSEDVALVAERIADLQFAGDGAR